MDATLLMFLLSFSLAIMFLSVYADNPIFAGFSGLFLMIVAIALLVSAPTSTSVVPVNGTAKVVTYSLPINTSYRAGIGTFLLVLSWYLLAIPVFSRREEL